MARCIDVCAESAFSPIIPRLHILVARQRFPRFFAERSPRPPRRDTINRFRRRRRVSLSLPFERERRGKSRKRREKEGEPRMERERERRKGGGPRFHANSLKTAGCGGLTHFCINTPRAASEVTLRRPAGGSPRLKSPPPPPLHSSFHRKPPLSSHLHLHVTDRPRARSRVRGPRNEKGARLALGGRGRGGKDGSRAPMFAEGVQRPAGMHPGYRRAAGYRF